MVTSWERKGIEKGIEKGLEKGLQEGREGVILKQLNHRFGKLEEAVKARINALAIGQLDALALALMDFRKVSDLTHWLDDHACSQI